jgi:hypothetical protein
MDFLMQLNLLTTAAKSEKGSRNVLSENSLSSDAYM